MTPQGLVGLALASFFLAGFGFGQTAIMPDDVALLKAKFLKQAEEISGRTNDGLNQKYTGGVEKLRDKKQAEGDLESVLALNEELKVVKETGTIGTKAALGKSGLARLQTIYAESHQKWEGKRQIEFDVLKAGYVASLEKITADLTIANELENAILVRNEAKEVSTKKLVDFVKAKAIAPVAVPERPEAVTATGKRRAGQVRGFGRLATTRERTEWADFDLTPLQQYTDFIDVTGSPYLLYFLRENGDVLDEKGEVVGRKAVKLITEGSLGGYLDAEGLYHEIFEGGVPEGSGPIKEVKKFFQRRIALKQNDEVFGWGGEYETGKRTVPASAKTGIRQLGIFYEWDYALGKDGRLHRWNTDGEGDLPKPLQQEISHISMFSYTGVVLAKSGDLFHMNGFRPPYWNNKAKHATSRGEFTIIQDLEDQWHVFAHEKTPLKNELEVLNGVLNLGTTIDVECSLYYSERNNMNTASYAVWIEEVGTPPLDLENKKADDVKNPVPKPSGRDFFGIEIE